MTLKADIPRSFRWLELTLEFQITKSLICKQEIPHPVASTVTRTKVTAKAKNVASKQDCFWKGDTVHGKPSVI